MEIKNFKEVKMEEMGNLNELVLYYPTQNTRPVLIRYEDIPWAIINTPLSNQAVITDLLDCFICNTAGNWLMDMAQTPDNFKWRSRLLELEEQLDEGKIPHQVVEFALYE